MQVTRFNDGGFVVHKLYLDGIASRFSIWVDRFGNLQDAERRDARNRAYAVSRKSRAWARLDGRCQIIASNLARNGPTPQARYLPHGEIASSPWAP